MSSMLTVIPKIQFALALFSCTIHQKLYLWTLPIFPIYHWWLWLSNVGYFTGTLPYVGHAGDNNVMYTRIHGVALYLIHMRSVITNIFFAYIFPQIFVSSCLHFCHRDTPECYRSVLRNFFREAPFQMVNLILILNDGKHITIGYISFLNPSISNFECLNHMNVDSTHELLREVDNKITNLH